WPDERKLRKNRQPEVIGLVEHLAVLLAQIFGQDFDRKAPVAAKARETRDHRAHETLHRLQLALDESLSRGDLVDRILDAATNEIVKWSEPELARLDRKRRLQQCCLGGRRRDRAEARAEIAHLQHGHVFVRVESHLLQSVN